jgi:KDO2-lipid IV(A) lauroyltransferase
MNRLLYFLAKGLIGLIQRLPLRVVARLGRLGGAVAFYGDARHRDVAIRNLTMCFGEKARQEIRSIAKENFKRIGENFASAVKTASMSFEELQPHLEFHGSRPATSCGEQSQQGIVAAIGHFGNFELYARMNHIVPGYKIATTYRGLKQPAFNALLQSLRERSGCLYFERRFESVQLKAFMNEPCACLGLLADQHAGSNGLRLPFLGHECSTSAAPAIFALRYRCKLITGFCYRVGLARWRVEAGPEIATSIDGQPRTTTDIMLDVNRAFEAAVLRDPANWFWVHNRWKPARRARSASARIEPLTEAGTVPHG